MAISLVPGWQFHDEGDYVPADALPGADLRRLLNFGLLPRNLPKPIAGTVDPRLVASLGSLPLLWDGSQRTRVVGRAPTCDLVLPESCDLASWTHCELGWDEMQVTIKDLASTNGTWVNCKRLYDGEVRSLRDGDLVHLSPEPLLTWAQKSSERLPTSANGNSPLEFQIWYPSRDDFTRHGLSRVGHVVRDCLDEINNIRSKLQDLRVRSLSPKMSSPDAQPNQMALTMSYIDGRNRRDCAIPDRPGTPVFIPPPALPVPPRPDISRPRDRSAPHVRPMSPISFEHDELLHVHVFHDPTAPPRNHPDIIYRERVAINVDAYTDPRDDHVPDEILRWSKRYCLPMGLHRGWDDLSSVPYGPRLPPSAAQPHHFPNPYDFVPIDSGIPVDRTAANSSEKRKRSTDDVGEPATVKRHQTKERRGSQAATLKARGVRRSKAKGANQSRASVKSDAGRKLQPEVARDTSVDRMVSHQRPPKRKRDASVDEQWQSKRYAVQVGATLSGDTLNSRARTDGRTSTSLSQQRTPIVNDAGAVRRSARVRDRAALAP